jgi:hypothetical protein
MSFLKFRRTMFLVWLAVGVFVPLTSSAQTPQAQTEQPLVNAVTQTLTGVMSPSSVLQEGNLQIAVPESCRFSFALRADQKAIEGRRISEINFNREDNTCDALFEVGEPAAESSPSSAELANQANTSSAWSEAAPIRTDDLTADDAAANDPLNEPLTTTQSAGYLKTWWTDPVHITVNSVQDSTTWKWSGTGHCVKGISGGYVLTWFRPSGWRLLSNSWNNSYNCTETTTASRVLYKNSVFCAFDPTYALYNPNMVNGRQNGDLVGTWNDRVYGSVCVHLLRSHWQLKRTQN